MPCPIHGTEWKTVPAGVSSKTGKPYNAFRICPVSGCQQRPPQAQKPNGGGSPVLGQPSASQGPWGDVALIVACLNFAGAIYAGRGQAGVEDAKTLASEMFQNWKGK